ncbi:F0F1 ATP synthase subunit B [Candidatus Poribacteria bacterium]|jgi:F-type H+-transporting ATPase subunit b|nr:F0F1 ATP synthase subunit B [Candidatus Poribacteria bacterium]MBT5536051.1 F0F1 ATP synthase subunit B [Candidatus Poribacteria bacterium]MBT5713125.1 F0F1 ATP synthase subunit B [Candidatus Poribacteria bacterium]MBT7098950.1 F0F1 ATP synthase subunit B [Candidatus Poribacteria bacterium]MBT7808681.1 F0F1 ATP synthase subunit B [Candidatus Poribacteria bacterium]
MQISSQESARRWPARVVAHVVAAALAGAAYAADTADGAHAAADASPLGALHIQWEIIVAQGVGFLVMFLILWKMVFSRVGSILDRRRTDITDRLHKIEQDQYDADRNRSETERQLAEIGREAQARYETAAREGEEERERLTAEAREAAQAELDRAQASIVSEKAAAILELRAEVAALVIQATRQILGESLDEERQRQIVDDMIERLPTE